MNDDSQPRSLTQRLEARIEKDQAEITIAMDNALSKHGRAFENALKNGLCTIEQELLAGTQTIAEKLVTTLQTQASSAISSIRRIKQEASRAEKSFRRLLFWSILTTVVIAVCWLGLLACLSWTILQKAQIQAEITSMTATLESLRAQTSSVQLIDTSQGTFLILPPGTTSGWKCGEMSCLRLPPGRN